MLKRLCFPLFAAILLLPLGLTAQKSRSSSRQSTARSSSSKSSSSKTESRSRKSSSSSPKKSRVSSVPKKSTAAQRNIDGKIKRSASARYQFLKQTGYPKGRKGYLVDHIIPLECGGADVPSNMQWQTVQAAKMKDRTERNCRR